MSVKIAKNLPKPKPLPKNRNLWNDWKCESCNFQGTGWEWAMVDGKCPECSCAIYKDVGYVRGRWMPHRSCDDGNVCYGIPF